MCVCVRVCMYVYVFMCACASFRDFLEQARLSHESLVVGADLLHVDVELAVDEGLCGRVAIGDGHDARDVLEVVVVLHLHLQRNAAACSQRALRVQGPSCPPLRAPLEFE